MDMHNLQIRVIYMKLPLNIRPFVLLKQIFFLILQIHKIF